MEKMNIFYFIIIIGVFATSCSQLLLKKSAKSTHTSIIFNFLNWKIIIAYSVFLASMFINIIAVKNGIQVKDLPILEALGYIFVPILAHLFMSEPMNKRKIFSIAFIIMGVIIFYQ